MIRLSRASVGEQEKNALARVIDASYLGMGTFVRDFEQALGVYLGVNPNHVVCVNTGTSALHLALMAAGVTAGDEVLVQSLTFVASFQAISATGATPVACEILTETCTIDLADAEKKITKKTKAIMPVHYASRMGNLDAVYTFARTHNLRVIEDAAHAFGCTYNGKKVGSFGDILCFSFDGIKNITCGEGGAVITSDEKILNLVKDARLLGVQKDTEKRYSGARSWEFDVTHQGYRYHMSNLCAAIGIAQLQRLENEFKPIRQRLAQHYHERLSHAAHIHLFPNNYTTSIPHIFPIRVIHNQRNALREFLLQNEIECGIHYYPNHLLTYYGTAKGTLPVTEKIYAELLTLPLHCTLTEEQQNTVIDCIIRFCRNK